MTGRAPRIYLAGPDIFREDAAEFANWQKAVCRDYGLEPLHPMDNNFKPDFKSLDGARDIYHADVGQMLRCDVICANMGMFRGPEPDSGTCFEVGFIAGLNAARERFGAQVPFRPLYGYVEEAPTYPEAIRMCGLEDPENPGYDVQGCHITPWEVLTVNLMMEIPMHETGAFITTGFEDCIAQIAADWKAGKFTVA
ncbi:MAG: hypothetical protein GC134_01130 [Proteobacteria bacterium]|nr:hypothetical protein [Pseudomonadota bacterium]